MTGRTTEQTGGRQHSAAIDSRGTLNDGSISGVGPLRGAGGALEFLVLLSLARRGQGRNNEKERGAPALLLFCPHSLVAHHPTSPSISDQSTHRNRLTCFAPTSIHTGSRHTKSKNHG